MSNRERLQSVAKSIESQLEPGSTFFLLTQKGDSLVDYIANGRREDTIKMMEEFLDRQPLQKQENN